ncbi:hypothetical protein GCM10009753_52670 [Streptantibioticus ferralitis]
MFTNTPAPTASATPWHSQACAAGPTRATKSSTPCGFPTAIAGRPGCGAATLVGRVEPGGLGTDAGPSHTVVIGYDAARLMNAQATCPVRAFPATVAAGTAAELGRPNTETRVPLTPSCRASVTSTSVQTATDGVTGNRQKTASGLTGTPVSP